MKTREASIINKAGIHARPASMIVQAANKYACSIWIEKDDIQINAKSIMNILAMGLMYEMEIVIRADGPDEEKAIEELYNLFDSGFQEE